MRVYALIAGFLLAATVLRAESVAFQSGEKKARLLELYTSEGCSSCPPAEAWIGALKDKPGLWSDFVPVAFHVDYWNSLGWPDPYSSAQFTQRQHDYADGWRADSVYTPEFVLDAAEWRPGLGSTVPVSTERPGVLGVVVEKGNQVAISFHPAAGMSGPFFINIAPLGFGVVTNARGGENKGLKLVHEFLALGLLRDPMVPGAEGIYGAVISLPAMTAAPIKGMAAWVTSGKSEVPIQATGGFFDKGGGAGTF